MLRPAILKNLLRPSLARASSSAASTANPSAGSSESTFTRRVGAVLFSSICGGTACLCYWQVNRRQWKLALMEERSTALAAAPQPLRALVPEVSAGLSDAAQYKRVTLAGEFDHTAQVLVGPRSAPAGAGVGGGAPAGAANASGCDVVTPLQLADGSGRVLVNRGWVPRESVASIEQPHGAVTIDGVLKHGEPRNKYATNDVANGRYIWLDLPTLASETASDPLLVVAVGSAEDGGGAAGGAKKPPRWPHARPVDSFMNFHVTPSTHAVYAATWAALSAAGAAITYLRFIK